MRKMQSLFGSLLLKTLKLNMSTMELFHEALDFLCEFGTFDVFSMLHFGSQRIPLKK